MPRMHLMEIEDQPWCPGVIRDAATGYLAFVARVSGHAAALLPKLRETLARSGQNHIIDLCSGGAGPILAIAGDLRCEITMTDLYPNIEALRATADNQRGNVHYVATPVDARAVPDDLVGLRVIFNAFHHFQPDDARAVLQDAVRARQPIAIFELVAREPGPLVGMLLTPLLTMLVMPFVQPFNWRWIPLTWLIPVIPALVLFDGVVSCLRVYSVEELRALVAAVDAPGWSWDIGRIALPGAPSPATYLVGHPPAAAC